MNSASPLDLPHARADFPFLQVEVNGRRVAYLDNGASTQKPRAVIERMAGFSAREYANVHRGIHLLSERATAAYEAARERAAEFLGAPQPECIVFTRGTTEGINLVANAWGEANVRAGDTILLTEMEHHSNLVPWIELARRKGARVKYAPVTELGAALDLEAARRLIAARPRLFAFAHVSNTLGVISPAAELCALARELGVTTLIDGAQSAGHLPVNVSEIDCDFFACSAHKMCGPTGIGLLYGRHALLEAMPPWQYGGEMVERVEYTGATFRPPPARFEAGTPAIIEAAGLHAALDYVESVGLPAVAAHCERLGELTAEALRAIEGVRVFGPPGHRAGLVTFHVESVHAHDLAFFANDLGVAMRAGHHCAQPLMRKLGAPSSCRMSFYLYNTDAELARGVEAVREAIDFFSRS
ncbi:MAG: SufS family cysteine desulfurase [Terrimicrobiaceae bacterium]|nr:SufS family cysteine desulfurase [Terrimicrobiaceae bacterium]